MNIRAILTCLFVVFGAAATTTAIASEKPNILFIFLDDFGWKDTSYMGSDFYETPHLDKLATQGRLHIVFGLAQGPGAHHNAWILVFRSNWWRERLMNTTMVTFPCSLAQTGMIASAQGQTARDRVASCSGRYPARGGE